MPLKRGRLGIHNITQWNKTAITKYVDNGTIHLINQPLFDLNSGQQFINIVSFSVLFDLFRIPCLTMQHALTNLNDFQFFVKISVYRSLASTKVILEFGIKLFI